MRIETIETAPVPGEGIQWDGSREQGEAIIGWLTGTFSGAGDFSLVATYTSAGMKHQINLGGVERLVEGDWLVKNNNGVYMRYSGEEFPKRYRIIDSMPVNEFDIRETSFKDGPAMFDPETGINIINPDGTSLLTITPKGQVIGNIHNAGDAAEIFADALRTALRKYGRLDGAKLSGAKDEIITYNNATYFRTCDEFVDTRPGGRQTFCVKPTGHPSKDHEDIDGVKRNV